jgi:hypothetical protein
MLKLTDMFPASAGRAPAYGRYGWQITCASAWPTTLPGGPWPAWTRELVRLECRPLESSSPSHVAPAAMESSRRAGGEVGTVSTASHHVTSPSRSRSRQGPRHGTKGDCTRQLTAAVHTQQKKKKDAGIQHPTTPAKVWGSERDGLYSSSTVCRYFLTLFWIWSA